MLTRLQELGATPCLSLHFKSTRSTKTQETRPDDERTHWTKVETRGIKTHMGMPKLTHRHACAHTCARTPPHIHVYWRARGDLTCMIPRNTADCPHCQAARPDLKRGAKTHAQAGCDAQRGAQVYIGGYQYIYTRDHTPITPSTLM